MAYINASSAVNRVKLVLIHQADMAGSTPVETDFYTAASNTTGSNHKSKKGNTLRTISYQNSKLN